jgi:selenocysteine lyase/cysteine desulfurase
MRPYERPLAERLISGLLAISGVMIFGITDPPRFDGRALKAGGRRYISRPG